MKLREIERLRGVAILMAMSVHSAALAKLLPIQLTQMWSGVDLFFVISGFVVSLSLARLLPSFDGVASFAGAFEASTGALRTFFMRRFFRIMPLAATVMILNRLLAAVYPPSFGHPDQLVEEAVAFFGGALNYTTPFRAHPILEFYWSLSVEEHFYLMLPFIFILCRTTSSRVGAAVLVGLASILARGLLPLPAGANHLYARFASHLRFDSLMAGVGLAMLVPKLAAEPLMPRRLMRFFVLPVAIFLLGAVPYCVPAPVMEGMGFIPLWALSALLVRFAALDKGYVLEGPVLSRVFEYVGSRSYGLYLVHRLMFRLEDAFGRLIPGYDVWVPGNGPHPWLKVVVGLAMSFAVTEILYRVVERPLNRLGHALSNPERGAYVLPRSGKVMMIAGGAVAAILLFHHPVLAALGPRNVARDKKVTMSSYDGGHPHADAIVNGSLETGPTPCTEKGKLPWMLIDLGTETSIGAIRVYNRGDGWEDEQIPMVVSTSDDGVDFRELARRKTMFTIDLPWRISLQDTRARYVRLMALNRKETPLCLSKVEIFESSLMAHIP